MGTGEEGAEQGADRRAGEGAKQPPARRERASWPVLAVLGAPGQGRQAGVGSEVA